MAKKRIDLGMLAMALAFGFALAGCNADLDYIPYIGIDETNHYYLTDIMDKILSFCAHNPSSINATVLPEAISIYNTLADADVTYNWLSDSRTRKSIINRINTLIRILNR